MLRDNKNNRYFQSTYFPIMGMIMDAMGVEDEQVIRFIKDGSDIHKICLINSGGELSLCINDIGFGEFINVSDVYQMIKDITS